MKIGICGRMCSGKSTLANKIIMSKKELNIDIKKDSFAAKIYEIAYDIFGMKEKNRELLQQIGTKFREINQNVWIDYIINKYSDNIIIDDVRYQNEIKALKENGFILIKLSISRELQIQRLKDLYKDNFNEHYKNIDHISELFVDVAPDNMFDIVIDVEKQDAFNEIQSLL